MPFLNQIKSKNPYDESFSMALAKDVSDALIFKNNMEKLNDQYIICCKKIFEKYRGKKEFFCLWDILNFETNTSEENLYCECLAIVKESIPKKVLESKNLYI